MPTVLLGNTKVQVPYKPDETVAEFEYEQRPELGRQTTVMHLSEDTPLSDQIREVAVAWEHHSTEPPAWVDSDDDTLRMVLARQFGVPEELPDGWTHGKGKGTPVESLDHLAELAAIGWPKALRRLREKGGPQLLKTNGGIDLILNAALGTAAQPAAANYMALTANATAPAATDTTLTAEITTAGGGLVRAQATYAHTTGTNVATLTKLFTANGSDALPVTLAKIGIFNAASAGTMAFETLLSATATLNASGDNVTVTDTFTLT